MAKNKSPKKKQGPPHTRPSEIRVGAMHLCPKCKTSTVHWMVEGHLVCSGCGTTA